MGTAQIIAQQTLAMFLLSGTGYLIYRAERITPAGIKDLASPSVALSVPAVILKSFAVEFTAEKGWIPFEALAVGVKIKM